MNRQIQHFWIIFRTEYFNKKHLDCAVDFFRKYDRISANAHDAIINDILNTNISEEEIKYAITYLKNNKSPGIDGIPAELIKACKDILSPDITIILNYIIENVSFLLTGSLVFDLRYTNLVVSPLWMIIEA